MDDSTTGAKQTVTGFGGSVTDATVVAYNMLPADKKAELLRKLMTGDGANFSLIRHSIGSSDLSPAPEYTYDDNNGQEDVELRSFQLGKSGTDMVSMLKEMKALQPSMILVGTSWAPPAWMQLDRKLVGTTDKNNLDHKYEAQFGQLFVKYLQAYKRGGVDVDAITIQNEPLNSNAGMPSLYVFPEESGKLIKDHVGPAISKAGFSTQVWAYDHNTDRPDYPQTVLDIAREFVPAVAWHCYAPGENWSALTTFHKRNPSVKQFQTECWTSAKQTKWNQASWFTMGPLQNWASGSMAWTLGTDNQDGPHLPYEGSCATCTGLFTVDANSKTYTLRTDYYMIGQYSRYIPRNAVVHVVTGSYSWPDDTGVESVATVNPDGSRTVVIENKLEDDVHVTLHTVKSSQVWSGKVSAKNVVATWLATTAKHLGRFVLAIRDFVPLARYIASQPRRVRITSSFSTAIDRAVHARADFHVLLSKYGNITDDTADSRHSHFAGILGAVRDLLRPLTLPSVPVMTGTCRTLGDKKLYYFNSFTPLTVYDTPDMDETVGGNMIAQPVYEAEREDTFEDACWAFSILLHDFTALRMQVKNLWERYARRELHLGSVAIATNAAIQIARSLEEDVEHLFAAHGGAHVIQKQWYGILCDDAGHDSRPEPGELLNWEAYRLADDCFLPANLMIAMFFEAYALGKMHHYNGNFDCSFFVGGPPRDVEAHFRNHALMMGCSLTNFARNRRAKKTDLRSKGSPRGLRIGAPITRFTGDLFRGVGARGGLSVEQVEQILSKGADRAQLWMDGRSPPGAPESMKTGKAPHNLEEQHLEDGDGSCKLATLVLHLAMALEAEIPEATFNYFTVYRTTWQALRDLWDDNATYFDKVFGELEVLRDNSRGPSLVTFILMAATGRNDWVALGRDLNLPLELSAQSVKKMLDRGVGRVATAELEGLGINIDGLFSSRV
uniref:glucan endo-1,6-beta-glucosidase n=1 Tax=Pyricularia oryzae (strain P131) TaxID=1143193 RepID=L7J6R4_PYRO1